MTRKTVLITGGSSGMGRASAAVLADKGYHVILLARDRGRGEAAVRSLCMKPERSVELIICDLGKMSEIKKTFSWFSKNHRKLDVLLNNAGVITVDRRETADGLELQLGVNHVGHFLLTLTLLPFMDRGGRIINVTSGAHRWGKIDFTDMPMHKGYRPFRAYGRSKLANVLFTLFLAEKLKPYGITVNCCHPGAVATDMGVDRKTGFGKGITRMLRPFFQTPEKGAETALFLSMDPGVEGVTGKYFYRKKEIRTAEIAQDKDLQKKLFLWTESVTGERLEDVTAGMMRRRAENP